MYLPMYSPTRVLLRLKLNGKQIYKKEIGVDDYYETKSIDKVRDFIDTNTKFTKYFDDFKFDFIESVITNPEG